MCTENQTPHVHAKEIKAWADGAIIQYFSRWEDWEDLPDNNPTWNRSVQYRVKPKEDVVLLMGGSSFRKHYYVRNVEYVNDTQRIEVTFDGETGLLKSTRLVPI